MKYFFLFLMVSLMTAPTFADETFSNADLLRNFDATAFGSEYTGLRHDHVRKWNKPIRIGIEGAKHPPYLEAYIEQVAEELSSITGHPIELYYAIGKKRRNELAQDFDSKNVNVFVLYLDDDEIPSVVDKYFNIEGAARDALVVEATCLATYRTKANEIKWALVVFPSRHPESFHLDCVHEEFAQILGLPNDLLSFEYSMFNDRSRYSQLTEHDKWLLRALYQKEITPGMHRHDALKAALAFWKKARP